MLELLNNSDIRGFVDDRNEKIGKKIRDSELRKIPFFVRGKARRNTERYASERGLSVITTETLYDAKAYFAR